MFRVTILLAVACSSLAQDSFAKKYAYTKVMTNCFGEEGYYNWTKEVFSAMKQCYGEEVNLPEEEEELSEESSEEESREAFSGSPMFLQVFYTPKGQEEGQDPGFPFSIPFKVVSERQKREAMYDGPLLKKMIEKVKAKVSNFTCVLKKMKVVNEEFDLDFDEMVNIRMEIPIDDTLKNDLVRTINHCKKLLKCLPLEDSGSPMPRKIQEIVVFVREKEARLKACMKYDLQRHLAKFDLSDFSEVEEASEGDKAEKLLHLLWGFENKDDFQLY
ncbi:uncharacterized protein LOC122263539 [Penaeus japonicus]|uniref:uncharacterized protein LOC122263539 n=1 Tax=Penaeus japonicus TaxID=27405 RepID=UPI001C713599|nr:uncharacterized protein LOC122263539 [Penaeus japonicus]